MACSTDIGASKGCGHMLGHFIVIVCVELERAFNIHVRSLRVSRNSPLETFSCCRLSNQLLLSALDKKGTSFARREAHGRHMTHNVQPALLKTGFCEPHLSRPKAPCNKHSLNPSVSPAFSAVLSVPSSGNKCHTARP